MSPRRRIHLFNMYQKERVRMSIIAWKALKEDHSASSFGLVWTGNYRMVRIRRREINDKGAYARTKKKRDRHSSTYELSPVAS